MAVFESSFLFNQLLAPSSILFASCKLRATLIVSCIDCNNSSLCLCLMLGGRVAVYQTWHCNDGN